MRTPNDQEHGHILSMSPGRRSFVARWTELYDPQTPFRWSMRPISRRLIAQEEEQIVLNSKGRRNLAGSTLYANLVDEEWRSMPKTMFKEWSAKFVENAPMDAAQSISRGLSLAGFSHELLFQARRQLLNGSELQEQLDSLMTWHSERSIMREFQVSVPIQRRGITPERLGIFIVPAKSLSPHIANEYQRARDLGHVDSSAYFAQSSVSTQDANIAWQLFRESYDRYKRRLRPPSRALVLNPQSVFTWDPYPPPDGRAIGFRPNPKYTYGDFTQLSGEDVNWATAASQADPIIEIILDQYLRAAQSLGRDDISEAFQSLVPLLDIGFSCQKGAWKSVPPFARTIELGALLLAFSEPVALFGHLTTYLRKNVGSQDVVPSQAATRTPSKHCSMEIAGAK